MIYIGEERNGYGRACMQCDYEAQRCCDKLAHVRVLLRTLVCVSRARMNVCMCERSRVRTPMSKRPYVAHTSEHERGWRVCAGSAPTYSVPTVPRYALQM